jgi:hypothetical protein
MGVRPGYVLIGGLARKKRNDEGRKEHDDWALIYQLKQN